MEQQGLIFSFKDNCYIESYNKLFFMKDTLGFPIEMACSVMKEKGIPVDWSDYYIKGIRAGYKPEGLVTSMQHCVQDVYGKDYFVGWDRSFKNWIIKNNDKILEEIDSWNNR